MRIAAAMTALVLASTSAAAAEIKATSRIAAVTVFPTGAEVTRSAHVRIDAGDHVAVLSDLPAQAIASSIRVEGKSTGHLEIGSVDVRRVGVPRTDPATAESERRAIELAIEKLRDERAAAQAKSQAAETQKLFVAKLIELPEHIPAGGPGAGAAYPDWNQLFALIGERTSEAQKVIMEAQVQLREIDRQIQDLEKKLVSTAPVQEERTEVKIFLTAEGALETDLAIRYQVASASWTPFYDARLTTGGKSAAPALTLVRRASLQQRSGEDWNGVDLALSTTRPGSGTAAPELHPILVDYEPDHYAPRPVAQSRSLRPQVEAEEMDRRAKAAPAALQQASVEKSAVAEIAAFHAIFTVPGNVTVPATGETKRVQIDSTEIEPALTARSVPRIDARAFLYAKITLPKGAPYLPGQVSLFRDGTFVGTGHLPQLGPGEDHELGFGADDSIRIRHAVIDDKRGESGIISSSKTDQRSYRVTVKNLHERPMLLTVLDQMPVSQNQDIKVELTGKSAPTKRDPDDKRGVLAWELKLEPAEEKQIEFGYRVTWPSGKNIRYAR